MTIIAWVSVLCLQFTVLCSRIDNYVTTVVLSNQRKLSYTCAIIYQSVYKSVSSAVISVLRGRFYFQSLSWMVSHCNCRFIECEIVNVNCNFIATKLRNASIDRSNESAQQFIMLRTG